MKIAIIGGGITGLAAANRLHELLPNAELSLYEAASRVPVGGVLESVRKDGFLVERSADNFLTKEPAAIDLCRRIGIASELLPTDESRRRAFVVRNGRLLPIPAGFYLMSPRRIWPLLASPVLSMPGKLRVLAEQLIPRRLAASSQSGFPTASDDESVASFVRRRLGCEAFERLVQPLVAGIYTADPEKLSMRATMPDFVAAEQEHGGLIRAARQARRSGNQSDEATGARYSLFVAPKNGMTSLVQSLAATIPVESIHLNTAVTRLQQVADNRWAVETEMAQPPSNPQSIFDAVLIAVSTHAAAHLLQTVDAALAAELATIEYAGCAVVSLGFNRRQIAHTLDGFGFVVPRVENRRIIAGSFASQKFPGRAPDDAVLIRVFVGGALHPELLDLPDGSIRQLALTELREILGIRGEPLLTDIARWPRSMPQYHVGHLSRVARIEELASRHLTLALAGNAYHGVGIPQCIASAEAAAERIAESLL